MAIAIEAVPPRSHAWRHALATLVLLQVCLLAAYASTASEMVAVWLRSDTFAHAILVLPIVLWLIWRQRTRLALIEPRPCPWVLLPMAGAALAWMAAELVAINSVTQLMLVALIVLAVPAVLGLQVTRSIAFPLGFLFFAVPIGEFMMPTMMGWTADFAALALRVSGIPVYREGLHLVIPSGSWSVVAACSGVRYLMASLMVGTLFAYLHYRSTRRRLAFVAISILVPLVANWLRAYMIIMIGHLTDNSLAVGADHLVFGWVLFGVIIAVMFAIGMWWDEPPVQPAAGERGAGVLAGRRASDAWPIWTTAAAAFAVLLLPHVAMHAMTRDEVASRPVLALCDLASDGWRQSGQKAFDWLPGFRNASVQAHEAFARDGREVALHVAYYAEQRRGGKLVSSDNVLVRAEDPAWSLSGRAEDEEVEIDGQRVVFRSAVVKNRPLAGLPERRLRVWHIYWAGDTLTASDHAAKIQAALQRLSGGGEAGASIVLSTSEREPGEGRAALESFARAHLSAIVGRLRRIGETSAVESGTQGAKP